MKSIVRPCLGRGTVLDITVTDDGQYSGGYYFGEFETPAEDDEHKKMDEIDLNCLNTDMVE